jgi:hypothetical protein
VAASSPPPGKLCFTERLYTNAGRPAVGLAAQAWRSGRSWTCPLPCSGEGCCGASAAAAAARATRWRYSLQRAHTVVNTSKDVRAAMMRRTMMLP